MINFNYANKAFKNYLKAYDVSNPGIKLKIIHTNKVIEFSEAIANSLGLDQTGIELSKLIALLHDIGRFEQIKTYGTFDDSKFDHADYSVYYLFQESHIRDFIIDSSYDELIKKAIANHSLYKISNDLNEQEKLYVNILRDADKLDIFRVKKSGNLNLMYNDLCNIESQVISNEVFNCIREHKSIDRNLCQSTLDRWFMTIGFVFDLNFLYSYNYTYENKCVETIINYFDYTNKENLLKIKEIQETTKCYIKGKLQI